MLDFLRKVWYHYYSTVQYFFLTYFPFPFSFFSGTAPGLLKLRGGAKTGLSVTSDTGGKVSFDFTVPEETAANGETPKTLSPRIFTAHARLGRFRHVKVSVTSPAVDEPLTVREVMLSCQEG